MNDTTKEQIGQWKQINEDLSSIVSFEKFNDTFDKTVCLFDTLGDNAMRQPIINIIGNKNYILCADFFLATIQTLKSITACCKLGNFSDANVLTRKFRDDLFQYLYIMAATDNIKGLTKEELAQYFNNGMTEEGFLNAVADLYSILASGIRKESRDKGIDAWFDNTLNNSCSKEYRYNFFKTSAYIEFINKNTLVKFCFDAYLKEQWEALSRRQNNFTHSNGRNFLSANTISIWDKKRAIAMLDQVMDDISLTTAFFLSVLILIKPSYISSSDYVDCLDCGLEPTEGSQYWVAPIVQDYIDEFVTKIHSGLKTYLTKNNPYGMEIK